MNFWSLRQVFLPLLVGRHIIHILVFRIAMNSVNDSSSFMVSVPVPHGASRSACGSGCPVAQKHPRTEEGPALFPSAASQCIRCSMPAEGGWHGAMIERRLVHSDLSSFHTLGCRGSSVAFSMILSWDLGKGMDN